MPAGRESSDLRRIRVISPRRVAELQSALEQLFADMPEQGSEV